MARKRLLNSDLLEIQYRFSDLYSSQHRAGAVGLVLAAGWVRQEYNCRGICEIDLSSDVLILNLDQLGLAELFNDLYAASTEEQERLRPVKNMRTGQLLPPIREVVQVVEDPESGSSTKVTAYIYESVVPRGSFLPDLDPTGDGETGLWIKLWREVVWKIFRGVPATRKPYEARAKDEPVSDYKTVWNELCRGDEYSVPLPGTYFIGAQTYTSENIPFRDRARLQFLLNFWPLIAQIYVPVTYGPIDKIELRGFVIAVPDVIDLVRFCRIFPGMMKSRGTEVYKPRQYRPRESIVELIEEAGLDLLLRVRNQLQSQMENVRIDEIVSGVDIFHMEREGNSVKLLDTARIDADIDLVNEYSQLRGNFWSPMIRRQLMTNLLNRVSEWETGFDHLFERAPLSQTFSNSLFRRDLQQKFSCEAHKMDEEKALSGSIPANSDGIPPAGFTVQELVYRAVANYLDFKLNPPGLIKNQDSDTDLLFDPKQQRIKVARDAFMASRNRRGDDFIDYFVSTICAAPQNMDQEGYLRLTRHLMEDTDRIRTFTLLALTAQSTTSK